MHPERPSLQVSHETIYTALYAMPRGELRSQLIACLRQGHKSRRPRARGNDRRGTIPNMTSIHLRQPEVDERIFPGHWEGDLIKGARNASAIGTLVERTSLFVTLARMKNASADAAVARFNTVLNQIDAQWRLSMTYDQGREMAQHERLTDKTGVKLYFADPHSPWQRGINENTNGLLRQYFPKGTCPALHRKSSMPWPGSSTRAPEKASAGSAPLNCSCPSPSTSLNIIINLLYFDLETAVRTSTSVRP